MHAQALAISCLWSVMWWSVFIVHWVSVCVCVCALVGRERATSDAINCRITTTTTTQRDDCCCWSLVWWLLAAGCYCWLLAVMACWFVAASSDACRVRCRTSTHPKQTTTRVYTTTCSVFACHVHVRYVYYSADWLAGQAQVYPFQCVCCVCTARVWRVWAAIWHPNGVRVYTYIHTYILTHDTRHERSREKKNSIYIFPTHTFYYRR